MTQVETGLRELGDIRGSAAQQIRRATESPCLCEAVSTRAERSGGGTVE